MLRHILIFVLGVSFFMKLVNLLKHIKLKGTQFSFYEVGELFIDKFKRNDLREKAGAVAFNFTMATFPSLIFFFTLIPYIPIDSTKETIMGFLEEILPANIYNVATDTFVDIIDTPRGGLLSFGFVLALIMALNGMLALMNAFNNCYRGKIKARSWLRKRLVACALLFLMIFCLVCSVIFVILGNDIIMKMYEWDWLDKNYLYYFLHAFRYLLIVMIFFVEVSLIYYFAPAVPQRWKFMSAGSWIATLLIILFSFLFSYYIDHFATYNKVYGSIGSLIGYMLWVFAISFMLLVGFEINATIDELIERKKREEHVGGTEGACKSDKTHGWG